MLIYLLKSGVCLAIFYGFYKLLLEKESIHTFKRYYLLISLIVSFYIPLITFTQYIEVSAQIIPEFTPQFSNEANDIIVPHQTNYLAIVLWPIYCLGVLLFSLRFIKNIYEIINKIKKNPKHKIKKITNVLLQDTVIPHTFFNYIFLNKAKFETNQIPKEVLLHEETHAKQKHSLDVLFIEMLQIVFWFNPIIYFIKHSIKLNHEFLADQAVIKHGIMPSTYQQILLAFSSNASHSTLANAINYPSIKKRFTIMKTQTSKKAFWLRSFILLPLLAILTYSFSEKKVVEKEVPESLFNHIPLQNQDSITEVKELKPNEILTILIPEKGHLKVNNLNLKITALSGIIGGMTHSLSEEEKKNLKTQIIANEKASKETIIQVKDILRDHKILKVNFSNEPLVGKLYIKELDEYNVLAKKFNSTPEGVFKAKDFKRVIALYNLMSGEQKKNAEPFPNFIPPPAISEDATPEEIKTHNKRYRVYIEITKDLKK